MEQHTLIETHGALVTTTRAVMMGTTYPIGEINSARVKLTVEPGARVFEVMITTAADGEAKSFRTRQEGLASEICGAIDDAIAFAQAGGQGDPPTPRIVPDPQPRKTQWVAPLLILLAPIAFIGLALVGLLLEPPARETRTHTPATGPSDPPFSWERTEVDHFATWISRDDGTPFRTSLWIGCVDSQANAVFNPAPSVREPGQLTLGRPSKKSQFPTLGWRRFGPPGAPDTKTLWGVPSLATFLRFLDEDDSFKIEWRDVHSRDRAHSFHIEGWREVVVEAKEHCDGWP